MNEQQYRDVLLAKAIETPTSPDAALLSQHDTRVATEKALHELRSNKSSNTRKLERLAARRAQLLLHTAASREKHIAALRTPARRWSAWLWWLPALALILGFCSEKITEPHRLSLIALPLLAIVVWNLVMYLAMLARLLIKLLRRNKKHATATETLLAVPAPVQRWWSRSTAAMKEPAIRSIYQRFLQDWSPYLQRKQARLVQCMLHLCAAMLAVGVVAGLWVTGMFAEYRIGWESTWLNAQHMQYLTNLLTWPAQKILGMPAWTLEQMQLLQTWPTGNQQGGQQWIVAYSLLLVLVVVLPRLLLALWNAVAMLKMGQSLHLPLASPYFQKLARDFSSDTTLVLIHPFSMTMNAQRQQVLQHYVHAHLGAAAHLQFAPKIEYGEAAGNSGYFRDTLQDTEPNLQILLFNLSATPEEETHGAVMAQFEAATSGAKGIWLYSAEMAERMGNGAAALQRLDERKHLWQHYAQIHDLHIAFIDAP
ncbi:DUF2868 domain-containing protein [Lampropedia puyangensis]|uniref:DUF2868 domain-containing protein n=1 Tax=Lampropedia puyangensis TaxID=1330072 RepID=A0A4V4GRM7_9BURK|nr:DUF2868 domain-containing protein [Lampropedia puyangensis]THU02816.1 DUF2868 domain-containing protein [Lampropedia puyangensis]